jgi:hypothetical protein
VTAAGHPSSEVAAAAGAAAVPAATVAAVTPAHVAIVGCGFAGTSALWQLVDRFPVARITVFEASGEFGPGYPYREDDCPDYLVNNTTDTMCLASTNRRAFVEWLRATGHPGADDPRGHLPRGEFGRFLREVVRAAVASAAIKGIRVDLVPHEVTAIEEPAAGGVRLRWTGGEILADAALLATGRCPDASRVAAPPPGAAARLVSRHVRDDTLDAVAADATVHVLGASLSAYDVVNRLFSSRTGARFVRGPDGMLRFDGGPNARRVVLASRSGRLKKVGSAAPSRIARTRLTMPVLETLAAERGGLVLEDLLRLADEEAAGHGASIDWDAVRAPYAGCDDADAVDARAGALLARDLAAAREGGRANFLLELVGDCQRLLWDAFAARLLRADEERRYRRDVETAMLCWAAPCPIPTAERLLALHRAGRLVVRRGAGVPVLEADGAAWTLPHAYGTERATVLVDCSGAVERRLAAPGQAPLYAAARASGLMRPYARDGVEAEGVDVDMATHRAIGSRAVYVVGMMLWGPGFFTSSAFMTARAVERSLEAMSGRG